MNDAELLRRFDEGTIACEGFHHVDHVRVSWLLLRRHPVFETLGRITSGLRRFAAARGQPSIYHETMTCFYVLLINQRMHAGVEHYDWTAFAQANPDLLRWGPDAVVYRYYQRSTLDGELARSVFVLPDKLADKLHAAVDGA